jgi:O-antigen/teichoic acid export membrane protein
MFWSIYCFFTYPLSIKSQTFSISKISLLAAGVNIIGNIILIPYFGIWAALGTTYFSYLVFGVAGLFNRENRTFLNRFVNVKQLCFVLLLLNLSLFCLAFYSKDFNWIFKGSITFGTAVLVLLLFKKFFPHLFLRIGR